MFTGLVQHTVNISAVKKSSDQSGLTISFPFVDNFPKSNLGDSIAVNGCCLTVSTIEEGHLSFDVSKETLRCTNLGKLSAGSSVNLEWALSLGDRLGGHLVSGHIDGLAELREKSVTNDNGLELKVACPKNLSKYLVTKGSVCIDGISLTINELTDFEKESIICLTIIPTTMAKTTLDSLEPGWCFNLEVDMMAKFAVRMHERG